jgi:hypothetical protein
LINLLENCLTLRIWSIIIVPWYILVVFTGSEADHELKIKNWLTRKENCLNFKPDDLEDIYNSHMHRISAKNINLYRIPG